ncbi:MAG: hypothetical protein H6553_02005 [Chitinophagales bacterium]|nr:hypothetical protein [Chitinophagales bacterium]
MKRNSVLTVIAIVLIIFVKCQSNEVSESADVNQDKIYQQYKVYYEEDNSKVGVEATFRFDGKNGNTLNLSAPSKVTINGETLKEGKKFMGGREYNGTTKIRKKEVKDLKIDFTDINHKVYQQIIPLQAVGKIKVPKKVKKGESFTISWENTLSGNDDKLNIDFRENYHSNTEHPSEDLQATQQAISFTEIAIAGENSITIDGSRFRTLQNDTVYVNIDKDKALSLQQATQAGGIIYYNQDVYSGMIIFK